MNYDPKALLVGAHPDLVRVVQRASEVSSVVFKVTEVLRTLEQQKKYLSSGKSTTLKSRHLPSSDGKSRAVDVAAFLDGDKLTWEWKYYASIAEAFKQASKELNVPIEWGGDWTKFKDGPKILLM
jgi:peptidoglycan L-alanyl-D-glutamate endopeptidase CwlK